MTLTRSSLFLAALAVFRAAGAAQNSPSPLPTVAQDSPTPLPESDAGAARDDAPTPLPDAGTTQDFYVPIRRARRRRLPGRRAIIGGGGDGRVVSLRPNLYGTENN